METQTSARQMLARYKGQCVVCAKTIQRGAEIFYAKPKGAWHIACEGKTPVPLNSRIPDQLLSLDADLTALAAKHGRVISGDPVVLSLMVSDGHLVGDVLRSKGRRLLLLTVSRSRYYSRTYLEDMDMFHLEPGKYADAQAVAVEPTLEEAAAAAEADVKKLRMAEVDKLLRASRSHETILVDRPKVTLEELHGAHRLGGSETWYLGSDGAVYYCQSDYQMGPRWWRTSATPELVREAKELGLKA
jgi:hypothetical protein